MAKSFQARVDYVDIDGYKAGVVQIDEHQNYQTPSSETEMQSTTREREAVEQEM